MGSSIAVFSFLIVLSTFVNPLVVRSVARFTNFDITSFSVLIISVVAAWAAGDAYRTFGNTTSQKGISTVKMAVILLIVQIAISSAFDLIGGNITQFGRLSGSYDIVLGVIISWLIIFLAIFAGFSFGTRSRSTKT